jgi:hypothetical protein
MGLPCNGVSGELKYRLLLFINYISYQLDVMLLKFNKRCFSQKNI